ncbi:hypothetical protein NpNSSI1_00011753 [Neofusicoccum parvum]|nr:hypothetical protein NpNSSI1_00011753 [Neofusicoccum parvum]
MYHDAVAQAYLLHIVLSCFSSPPPTPPPTPPPSLSITLYPPVSTPPSPPASGPAISSLRRALGDLDAAVAFLRLSADGTALFGSTAARRTHEYSTARSFAGGGGGGGVDARVVAEGGEAGSSLVELLPDLVRQVWGWVGVVERILG